jgi:orotidine-5'-phosphate decarboxylase
MENAGLRLWEIQKQQRTGLCIGLDPHYEPDGVLNEKFYLNWENNLFTSQFFRLLSVYVESSKETMDIHRAAPFLSGVTNYMLMVINAAWKAGIRVYKPQSAFYEQFDPVGPAMLSIICQHIRSLDKNGDSPAFIIRDAKRGDLGLTQAPYFAISLTSAKNEVCPGINGQYGFDTMTVTTWMGEEVLVPGKKFFEAGAGAIVVTRSSNPSGTTLQDALIMPNTTLELSEKQEKFRYTEDRHHQLVGLLGRPPMVHEVMLEETEVFSRGQGLNDENGVSPIFSVMGSTTKMNDGFRKIRPNGIALIPGFGGQQGELKNVLALYVDDGPLEGHIGILASSRNHNYPWMKKFGGSGACNNFDDLNHDMERVINAFRQNEMITYIDEGFHYPF